MKRIPPFIYYEPVTVSEASEFLAQHPDSRVLAGGTDLLVDLKSGKEHPAAIVNLKRIEGLRGVGADDDSTRIGALTSVRDIERSDAVRDRHPALAAAAGVLASLPIRRLATIGGNLGRASPASDLAPPLMTLDAKVTVESRSGTREISVADLFVAPGETVLRHDEVITSIRLPLSSPGAGAAFRKLGKRGGGTDIALVGTAASVVIADGGIADACVVLASVGPTPLRSRAAEEVLCGAAPSEAVLEEAGVAAADSATPISDVRASAAYRTTLTRVLTRRTLRDAVSAARGSAP